MRRLFWTSTGYALGLGTSFWVQRRVRTAVGNAVDTYAPEQVRRRARERTRDLADRALRAVDDVREAAAEGRTAMRQSEKELRAEFGARSPARHLRSARSVGPIGPGPARARPRSG